MKNLSNETKTQTAIQIVIMDAIEKGHTNANKLIEYMKSEVFEKAVKNFSNNLFFDFWDFKSNYKVFFIF